MPGRFAGEKFNILNPFTYGNFGKVVDKTRKGDEDIEYSYTPDGQINIKSQLTVIIQKDLVRRHIVQVEERRLRS